MTGLRFSTQMRTKFKKQRPRKAMQTKLVDPNIIYELLNTEVQEKMLQDKKAALAARKLAAKELESCIDSLCLM